MKATACFLFLLGVVYLGFANFRCFTACFGVLDGLMDSFFVRQELKRIAAVIAQDYITDRTLPSGDFAVYVRGATTAQTAGGRDRAHDWWGVPYAFYSDAQLYAVGSAGRDRKWQSSDDIWVRRRLASLLTEAPAAQPAPRAGAAKTARYGGSSSYSGGSGNRHGAAAPSPSSSYAGGGPSPYGASTPQLAQVRSTDVKKKKQHKVVFFGIELKW